MFNECYERTEWAKVRCAEVLPFIDRLVHDKARDTVSPKHHYSPGSPLTILVISLVALR
jgi:hypothetical protein